MKEYTVGVGAMPDITWYDGGWLVVYREGDPRQPGSVVAQRLDGTEIWRGSVLEGVGFPRVDSYQAAYTDGETLWAVDLAQGSRIPLGVPAGNHPVAVGFGYVAWVNPLGLWRRAWNEPPEQAEHVPISVGSQGLARILSDGTVRTQDEERFVVPGHTAPAFAPSLVVAERPNGGLLCRRDDGAELILWRDQAVVDPRCIMGPSESGRELYAVTAWDARTGGIRAAILEAGDFTPAVVDPEPIVGPIDLMPFLVGGEWPHEGMHLARQGTERALVLQKGAAFEGLERFAWDDTHVRLWWDTSDAEGLGRPWALRDEAHGASPIWCARTAKVGNRWPATGLTHGDIERADRMTGAIVARDPFAWWTALVGAWRGVDCGGDVGVRDLIEHEYGMLGQYERTFYARGWGLVRWQEWAPGPEGPSQPYVLRREVWYRRRASVIPAAPDWGLVNRLGLTWPMTGRAVPPEIRSVGVTVDRYDAALRPGQPWAIVWHERDNPTLGLSGETVLVPRPEGGWSVHVELTAGGKSDRSGQPRIVRLG